MSEISKRSKTENYCLDFDCLIMLSDRNFMQRHLNKIMMMHKLASSLSMKEVDGKMLRTFKYITVCICLNVIDFE